MGRIIQAPVTNTTSESTVEVYTSTGFNAGDLVYYNNGNYTNASGLPAPTSLATYSGTNSYAPVGTNSAFGSLLFNPNPAGTNTTGSASGKYAALLTNGNIVQAYISKSTGYPTFQIVNSTLSSVVVAATTISSTYVNTNASYVNIGVIALTGGGFVVYWINTAGGTALFPCYAVYTNTGSVTTATTQDTGAGTAGQTYGIMVATALSNSGTNAGGFVLAYPTNSATVGVYTRAYNSTGTAQYSWQVAMATSINVSCIGIVSNSNNSTIIVANKTTGNNGVYAVISATGTATVSATTFSSTNSAITNSSPTDVTVLSDGLTFVLGYQTTAGNAFRFFASPYSTLGTEYIIPVANNYLGSASDGTSLKLQSLASGNFVMMYPSATVSALQYAVFNSSGVCLSGTSGSTYTAALPRCIYATTISSYSQPTAVELTGTFYIFFTNAPFYQQYAIQVTETNNWFPVPVTYTTQTITNQTLNTNGATNTGSTPTKVAYLTTAGTYASTPTLGTTLVSTTTISSSTVVAMSSTTLPNGNILFAYSTNLTSGNIFFTVYTPAGVLVSNTQVLTALTLSVGDQGTFQVTALSSGKVALAVASAASTISLYLFSSAFVQIGSTVTVSVISISTSNNFAIAPVGGDRYVLAFLDANNYLNYAVYSNTNTSVSTAIVSSALAVYNCNVVGFSNGSFAIFADPGSGITANSYSYQNTIGNTYTQISSCNWITTTYLTPYAAWPMVGTPNGIAYTIGINSSTKVLTTQSISLAPAQLGSFASSQSYISATWIVNGLVVGITGNGIPVALMLTAANTWQLYAFNSFASAASTTSLSFTGLGAAGTFLNGSITSGYGNSFVLSYINSSTNLPVFTIISANTSTMPEFYNVSSTASVTTPIYPNNTAQTPAISNTILAGVALTTASAGSTGQVQINGLAQLNSSYTTIPAQSFDYTGQAVDGVKGTVIGTQVNLQGNS